MNIQLSDHFTYKKLIRFTLPSIAGMIFASIYGVVDGFFISNFVGKEEFAAVNLIMPFFMIFAAVGFMFGSGGSALVAVNLGMRRDKKANLIFSMMIYTIMILGVIFSITGGIVTVPVARLLGADDKLLPYCVTYFRIGMISLTFFMLQNVFQTFFVTAERPELGLKVTITAGVTNMILDALFMGVFKWGVAGAAAATAVSETLGGGVPLVYFFSKNNSQLRLGKTFFSGRILLKAAGNGSSEFMSNISMSLVNMLYNHQLLKYAGHNGVASYGIIMYTNFIFVGVFFGYSMGVAPAEGYNFGAENVSELQNLFKKSIRIILTAAVSMTCLSVLASPLLAMIFTSSDRGLFYMTVKAIRIYSIAYLFMGINVYASSLFTALNNGAVSALISFLRAFVFQIICVFTLPLFFGLNGIWSSIVAAEFLAMIISLLCIILFRKRYHYFN